MSGISYPSSWQYRNTKCYLAEVSPISAILGVVGRLQCVPKMPKNEKDVNWHLCILPRLRRTLEQELFEGFPGVPAPEPARGSSDLPSNLHGVDDPKPGH